jgi:acetyl-CoA carboxylase carboxyltransferase component
MSWKAEIEELHQRRKLAEACGGPDAVARHHKSGKLTVRERIDILLDAKSFREVGKLAGKGSYDKDGNLVKFEPAPYVMGLGRIDGRPVAIGGEDYTIRAGTGFGSDRRKGGQGGFIEDLAYEYRIPLVNLIDGTGGTVNTAKRKGYSVVPGYGQDGMERSVDLLGIVPVVSAVMGTTAGGPSMRAILSHWSVMVKGQGQIFAAGPPVVERAFGHKLHKDELGGTKIAVDAAGTIDNIAQDEEDCFRQIRSFLSYMPQNVWELPPQIECGDPVDRCEDALASIVPRSNRQAYNMRNLLVMVVDKKSLFEIQPSFGRAVITALARMNGKVVGIVASNPMVGGIMDYKAARKQGHFTELCDMFNIPIILFADVPGLMVGVESESAAILREGVRARYVGFQVSVPVFSVIIRKCYGVAGGGFIDRGGLNFKIAWPSAEWGSLPVEGGVKAAYRREIENAPDPLKREKEIEDELRQLASPFRTAEAFAVEDIIDPRETRPYLCQFIDALQGRLRTQLGPKFKSGVRP